MSRSRWLPTHAAGCDRGAGGDAREARRRVHVSLLLDSSGSMEACRGQAVATVNRYLDLIQGDEAASGIRLSLTFFNSNAIETVRDRVSAGECPALRDDEFLPRGRTPLLDAVGYNAAFLDCLSRPDEQRILAIVTDGLENASREFSHASIREFLERKQREDGWLVVYLGADHDSRDQAASIGIPERCVADVSSGRLVAVAGVLSAVGDRYQAHDGPRCHYVGFTDAERRALVRAA